MNVLQIVPELNAGGVERTVLEVDAALAEAGHGSHVASLGGRMEGELRGTLHRLDMETKNPLRWVGTSRALRRIIRDHAIDIVHARSRAPAWPARAVAKREGAAWVTTYHGVYNAPDGPLGVPKRAYNAVMASGDVVIANSEFTRDHVISRHGTPPERIRVVPRGVDMLRFDPARVARAEALTLRREWGVARDATLWVLPGRLTGWKGQRVAIAALEHAPGAHLVCIGDAQGREGYLAELAALAAKLGVADRVALVGHSADMPAVYAAADVVLSASTDPEAFGRVAAEAQAMGRPVVASAHGGALETVEDGRTGVLVPPGDARALAEGCARALAMEFDAAYARARIAERFSDAALKARVLAIYGELVAGPVERKGSTLP